VDAIRLSDAALEKLPTVIQRIIKIDRELEEIKRAPVVRLSPELGANIRARRQWVQEADAMYGWKAKGKT
jgi:hypothetical protein